MRIEEFINMYLEKNDFFYRLRQTLGKEQLLVYYYGVKMFEIKDNKFIPSIRFFLPNSKNTKSKKIPKNALNDYNKMLVNNKKFIIHYKNINTTDYKKFYDILITLSSSEKQNVEFIGKDIKLITKDELYNIENILKSRIDNYSNNVQTLIENDFMPTTTQYGKREKVYQLKIMNIFNNNSEKEKIVKNNDVFKMTTYPLEMEYGFKTYKKVKQHKNLFIPEGRIDNIFIDNDTVNMVEIKIGTSVIAGKNGIHKHLLDVAYCIKNKIIEPNDFNNIINKRKQILDKYNLKNKINTNVNKIEYNIICGYENNEEKSEVLEKLDKIYKLNAKQVRLTTKSGVQTKSEKIKKEVQKLQEKYGELTNKNIEELLSYLEKNLQCKTKIYIANDDYTIIEPYQYNINRTKM